MCGIAGAWLPDARDSEDALLALGRRLGAAIAHLMPDDTIVVNEAITSGASNARLPGSIRGYTDRSSCSGWRAAKT